MSRINTPAVAEATGATAALFAQIKKAAGKVPNAYAALGALNPAGLQAILAADAALAASSLSKQDIETVKLTVSQVGGCDYCVAAHSMIGKLAGLKPEALRQIRAGGPTGEAQRDALVRFVRQLVESSGTLPATEFAAIKGAGYSDQQIADIALAIALITYTNVFNRINDTDVDFPAVD
jgi:uncharacterized peroxidase-related enzyme